MTANRVQPSFSSGRSGTSAPGHLSMKIALEDRSGTFLHCPMTRCSMEGRAEALDVLLEQGAGEPQSAYESPQAGRSTHQLRILIVEDNPDTGMLMRFVLEEAGSVEVARSASEALEAVRVSLDASNGQGHFDLFLLDINLGEGELSGMELLAELREIPPYAKTPIAAVTAYAQPDDRRQILSQGFDGFLGKPFTADQLTGLVERLTHSSPR